MAGTRQQLREISAAGPAERNRNYPVESFLLYENPFISTELTGFVLPPHPNMRDTDNCTVLWSKDDHEGGIKQLFSPPVGKYCPSNQLD